MKHVTRRQFLGAVAAAPLLVPGGQRKSSAAIPHRMVIAGVREPGTRIVITGVVFSADGKTPAPDVQMDAYHTDDAGFYARPKNDPRLARLKGALATGSDGEYTIETILPGHYGDVAVPPSRHIHVHVATPQFPQYWIESFLFDGDPRLTAEQRAASQGLGRFAPITRLAFSTGDVLHYRRDIRIDPVQAERNRMINGWYR